MSGDEQRVEEVDLTPYLHMKMAELKRLCTARHLVWAQHPTKAQLQELLAGADAVRKANGNPDEEEDEEETNVPEHGGNSPVPDSLISPGDGGLGPPHLNPVVILDLPDVPSTRVGNGGPSPIARHEDDILLDRLERRAALEKQLLDLEKERAQLSLGLIDGGSKIIPRDREETFSSKIPKGIVPRYKEGDDIDKYLTAFERACEMRNVPTKYWGAILLELFEGRGRDRLLALTGEAAKTYSQMKETLIDGLGLTTEEYRMKFRETKKNL